MDHVLFGMPEESVASRFMSANAPKRAYHGLYKKIPHEVIDACYMLKERGYTHNQIGQFLSSEGFKMTKDQIQKMLSRDSF